MVCAAARALVLAAVAGCVSYRGGARPIDPARLVAEPGWLVAAPTVALRQAGESDCGAAALAMVARRWSVLRSVDEAAAALPAPGAAGTRLGDLRDAASAHGLAAFAIAGDRATLIHELRAGRPVILGLLLRYGRDRARGHYEVLVGVHAERDRFVTIDPARGWRTRSWAALEAEWGPVGHPTLILLGLRAIAARPVQ
ncbi:MAG TPA: cysteine peptidase family C39 domain-containing protein [Kofleriaceae bacterium]|nr:cysteine peptidase family C39 domain-containing protein [Kofleriaceae bacterium]